MKLILLIILVSFVLGQAQLQTRQEWDASNYPNPTSSDSKRCGMRSQGLICDPDEILTEAERLRINYELQQLEQRTRQDNAPDFCEKKGVTAALAIAKHVRGGAEYTVKTMANDMLRNWNLDHQCQKALVIVMATDDRKFWVARDQKVPVYGAEFTDLFDAQKPLFKSGNYQQALLNIIRGTWEKALDKQSPRTDGGRGGGGQPFVPAPKPVPKDNGGGIFSKIPIWVWLLVIFVVIPTLCCCCCLYFCCFKKKGGAGPTGGTPGYAEEGGIGHNRRSGGGGGLNGFLSGIGGAAAFNSISNIFNKRGGGGPTAPMGTTDDYGRVPASDSAGGGYNKPQSVGGLYPTAPVKDEGGGGSW